MRRTLLALAWVEKEDQSSQMGTDHRQTYTVHISNLGHGLTPLSTKFICGSAAAAGDSFWCFCEFGDGSCHAESCDIVQSGAQHVVSTLGKFYVCLNTGTFHPKTLWLALPTGISPWRMHMHTVPAPVSISRLCHLQNKSRKVFHLVFQCCWPQCWGCKKSSLIYAILCDKLYMLIKQKTRCISEYCWILHHVWSTRNGADTGRVDWNVYWAY